MFPSSIQRCLARPVLLRGSTRFAAGHSGGLGTAAHPNPGNFANRPKEELHEIAKKGGHRGGKAKGVGGFHNMDPEKQHAIASRGGRAVNKAAQRHGRRVDNVPRPRAWEVDTPSSAPPGFEEWRTV